MTRSSTRWTALVGAALVATAPASVLAGSVLAASVLVTSPVHAQTSPQAPTGHAGNTVSAVRPELLARVERALVRYEGQPSASYWSTLGPEGLAALREIIDGAPRPQGLRRRAVVALRHYDQARPLLESLVERAEEDEIVVRYALTALVSLRGVAAMPSIERALGDRRALVRLGAVRALETLRDAGTLTTERARAVLAPLRASEPDAAVRASVEQLLSAR